MDTGALLTNSRIDDMTLTNVGTVVPAGISVKINDIASFNGINEVLTGTIEEKLIIRFRLLLGHIQKHEILKKEQF